MATVFDVADYILNKKGSMTTMKLQKLCYYSQAWSLAWDEEPLFKEEFEAWANGPVCRELFDAHKGKFRLKKSFFSKLGNASNLTETQKATVNAVLDYYGDWEPQELSGLTHREKPWLDARKNVPFGENCEEIIQKEAMQQFYGGLIATGSNA